MTTANGLAERRHLSTAVVDEPSGDASLLDAGELARALRRRWWLVLASVLVAALVGVIIVATTPERYTSSASIVFTGTPSAEPGAAGDIASDPDRFLETQAEVAASPAVQADVVEATGGPADYTVTPVFQTDLLDVVATASSPELAAATANAAADAYLRRRTAESQAGLATATDELTSRIDALDAEIASLEKQIAAVAPSAATSNGLDQQRAALINERTQLRLGLARGELAPAAAAVTAQIAALDAQIGALDAQISANAPLVAASTGLEERRSSATEERADLQAQLNDWGVNAALAVGSARVMALAEPDDGPIEPRPARTLAFALVIGLLVGVMLALLSSRSPRAARTAEDFRRAFPGVPVLTEVGARTSRRSRSVPPSVVAEEFRVLGSALFSFGSSRPVRRIQLTSACRSTDSSEVAANLALSLADAGFRTLVVDADLHRPRLATALGLGGAPGLAEVLRGELPIGDAVLSSRDRPVGALPAGRADEVARELLGGERLPLLLSQLAASCDVLVIDTPPVQERAEAAMVSLFVDATVVVTSPGRMAIPELRAAVAALGQVRAPLAGVVVVNGQVESLARRRGSEAQAGDAGVDASGDATSRRPGADVAHQAAPAH